MGSGIRRLAILSLFWALAVPGLADGSAVSIAISERIVVGAGPVRLLDVAAVQGEPETIARLENVDFGKAPAAGRTRLITRQFVQYKLARAGLKAGEYDLSMPDQVKLVGAGILLSAARLRELIEAALAPVVPKTWTSWQMDLPGNLNNRWLPPGEIGARVMDGGSELTPGENLLRIDVLADGKPVFRLSLAVRVAATAPVPVLQEDLERHALLRPSAFVWEERALTGGELTALPADKMRTTRRVRQGEILRRSDLEPAPLVEKGGRVLLEYHSGRASVSTYGRARRDGWLGQTIPVENLDSRRVVSAVVVGEGKAEVK